MKINKTMKIIKSYLLIIGSIVLILLIEMTHAGPDGAPTESCTTMTPSHGVEAQDGPCPFEIVALQVK